MRWLLGFAAVTLAASSGCALCCSPYDHTYAAYGTRVNRVDQQHGRVGSIFSDPAVASGETIYMDEDHPAVEATPGEFEELPAQGEEIIDSIPASSGVYLGEPEMLGWDE